jgi:hypothetical protein
MKKQECLHFIIHSKAKFVVFSYLMLGCLNYTEANLKF